MRTEPLKLNLGSGPVKGTDGWTTVDIRPGADVICDLNKTPWQWENDSVDVVHALSVLEHLRCDYMDAIKEIHRILKPGGLVRIDVPHCMGSGAFRWEHRHRFSWLSFSEIVNGEVHYAEPIPPMFDQISLRISLWDKPVPILDRLASRFPRQWERFGLFRPEGIHWTGRKKSS
jgi:SAM-dependent methyltransferase